MITFIKLNKDWNTEPNAPNPNVTVRGGELTLSFLLNHMVYPRFSRNSLGSLIFTGCTCWRIGSINDEAWGRGQCRYSKLAPAWGEFYEIEGSDPIRDVDDWHQINPSRSGDRHFLFYFRDEEFECLAADWRFSFASN